MSKKYSTERNIYSLFRINAFYVYECVEFQITRETLAFLVCAHNILRVICNFWINLRDKL